MPFPAEIIPGRFVHALHAIDAEAELERSSLKGRDYRPAIALSVAAFCLLITYYPIRTGTFEHFLLYFSSAIGLQSTDLLVRVSESEFYSLLQFTWRLSWLAIGFALLPLLVIKLAFKESIRDYWIGMGYSRLYMKWIILFAGLSIIAAIVVSFRKDFASFYPFYRFSSRSWADLILWECLYFSEILLVEFFFRGFLLKSCKALFGFSAILVMCLPYMMVHLGKPWPETVNSFFYGFLLGVLAMRSKSIWGCVLIHYSLAFTTDLSALLQKNGIPSQWWP